MLLMLAQWVLVSFFAMEGDTFAVSTEAFTSVQECNDQSYKRKSYENIDTYAVTEVVSRCYRVNRRQDDSHSHILVLLFDGEPRAAGYENEQECEQIKDDILEQYRDLDVLNLWGRCDKLQVGQVMGDEVPTRQELRDMKVLKEDLGI